MHFRAFIAEQLTQAGTLASTSFGKVSGMSKKDDHNQVLTETDMAIGKLLVSSIVEAFPDHNIIDEEYGVVDNGSTYTWVTDPIDGTSNFASGLPMYGIMMGLLKEDKPIAGGLYLPYFDELYTAEKGEGAYCNGQQIKLFATGELQNQLLAYGIDGHPEEEDLTFQEGAILARLALRVRNLRMSNSVFDVAQVLNGRYAAFINRTSKVWDNVAQQILIEEAGGVYTTIEGKPMNYEGMLKHPMKNFDFIACQKSFYDELLALIV